MARRSLPVVIRHYRDGDAPALASLYYRSVHELGPRRYTREQVFAWAPARRDPALFHQRATDGRTTLVAVDGEGEIMGYADLETDGHVDHLYCAPAAAGTGVAGVLLDAVIAKAVGAGMTRLYTEASELARGAFERKGFAVIRRRDFERNGVMLHNYAMERSLG